MSVTVTPTETTHHATSEAIDLDFADDVSLLAELLEFLVAVFDWNAGHPGSRHSMHVTSTRRPARQLMPAIVNPSVTPSSMQLLRFYRITEWLARWLLTAPTTSPVHWLQWQWQPATTVDCTPSTINPLHTIINKHRMSSIQMRITKTKFKNLFNMPVCEDVNCDRNDKQGC